MPTKLPLPRLLLASGLLAGLAATAAEPARPNVLFISIDDLRNELGCYGAPQVVTPNLDRLAAEGVRFDNVYCQVPTCGASRASLMTGILPRPDRFRIARTWAREDAPDAATLPQVFREAGYTTLSNGKVFHFADDTADRSWSEKPWNPAISHSHSLDPATTAGKSGDERGRFWEAPEVPDNAYKDGQTAERTIADLRRLKEAGRPFFLACGFLRPHLPFYAPKRYWDLYSAEAITLAGNRARPVGAPAGLRGSNEFRSYDFGGVHPDSDEFHRRMRHGYYASTSYVDKLVGDILAELGRLGLAENTIVVVWGDHGWHLGEHDFWGKHNTLRNGIRVPLLVRAPGARQGGAAGGLVELIDVFPTLCELAGLPVPATVQGRGFARLLREPSAEFRESAYARYGSGEAVMTEHFGYTRYDDGGEMLYDWRTDPEEDRNVAGDPAYAETLARHRALLAARQTEAAAANVPPPRRPAGDAPGDEPTRSRRNPVP